MATLWIRDGKLLVDGMGKPILCDVCPCSSSSSSSCAVCDSDEFAFELPTIHIPLGSLDLSGCDVPGDFDCTPSDNTPTFAPNPVSDQGTCSYGVANCVGSPIPCIQGHYLDVLIRWSTTLCRWVLEIKTSCYVSVFDPFPPQVTIWIGSGPTTMADPTGTYTRTTGCSSTATVTVNLGAAPP